MTTIRQKIYESIAVNEPIARCQLGMKCGIRLATITEEIRKLIEDQLVVESGTLVSTGGRKPVLLRINRKALMLIAVRAARDNIKCGLFDGCMDKKYEYSAKIPARPDNHMLLREIEQAINVTIANAGYLNIDIAGIGVSFPGVVDYVNGIFIESASFPGPHHVRVKDFLLNQFQVPVAVDHDAAGITMAEYYLAGSAPHCRNMGVLFIDKGIGSRFVIDGKLFRGAGNTAGEFGHLSLDSNGPECYCGNHGCFEQLAGINAIEKRAGKPFGQIIAAAASRDSQTLKMFAEVGAYVGEAIVNIFQLMDIEHIVINGRIAEAAPYLLKAMESRLHTGSKFRSLTPQMVSFSRLGAQVDLLGPAFAVAIEAYRNFGIDIIPVTANYKKSEMIPPGMV
jgi:predicted NBD/HSP70 family sugar kinase